MAFSGLPSKACANCRLRRIKCNLAEPECAQCRRAGKACPGYRDQLALLFRDENAKVIRKARGRPATHLTPKSKGLEKEDDVGAAPEIPQTTSSFELERRSNPSSPSLNILRNHLATSLEDPGIYFFFHQYMTDSLPTSNGLPDIFSSQLWRGVSQYEPFLDAVSCVGLAGLSNVKNDQQMMDMARMKYAVTLRRVMTSLQVPEIADMGYTLKAVMMLALFEMINCDSPRQGLWGVHLDGIAALLNSEGFQQFQEKFGVRIKHQFFFAMFIKHVQNGQPFPATMAKWARTWGASLGEADAPAAPLTEIMIEFVDFHASVRQEQVTDPNVVIQNALLLDEALNRWRNTLPPAWRYKVVLSSQTQGTYDGQYHIYTDHWTARMWDHYRWIRILVHELILTHITLLPSPRIEMYEQQEQKSLRTISHIASRICASVASQLFRPNPAIPRPGTKSQLTSVFMLLWPLKVAGSAIGVSEALHEWVIEVLENIGLTMGIRQARVVVYATIMQREYWKSSRVFTSAIGMNTL